MAEREPALAGFVHATILKHDRLEQALSYHLARKLGGEDLSPLAIRETVRRRDAADADFGAGAARRPVGGVRARSRLPFLCRRLPVLQRLPCAGELSRRPLAVEQGRKAMALFLQSRISQLFAVDIHPAAKHRPRHHARPCHRHRDRRNRGGGRRCLHHAGRHPGRHRQGKRRPPSQDPPRRAVVAGRQDPGQYRDRRI